MLISMWDEMEKTIKYLKILPLKIFLISMRSHKFQNNMWFDKGIRPR